MLVAMPPKLYTLPPCEATAFQNTAIGYGACSVQEPIEAQGVALGVGLGVVPTCTSNDPLSMRSLRTRQKTGPRWSKKGGGVKFGSPALIAGLPGNSACVKVGPPLSCNGPSIGSVLI